MAVKEHWKQFSLYPKGCRNKFQPQQVLHEFLPRYILAVNPSPWHVLFEPSALVRIVVDDFPNALLVAEHFARDCGLVFELGDCSADWIEGHRCPGEDYYGEAEKYGDDMWVAMRGYLQACSEMSIAISKCDHERQSLMTSKLIHLSLNTLGMTYLEESAFCRHYADRAVGLFTKYHRM